MTILQELAALYKVRAVEKEWPRPGFSTERVGGEVVLDKDGTVLGIRSLMVPDPNGDVRACSMAVPAAIKRTQGIRPNILWDKTAYALGITVTPEGPGQGKRTEVEHKAFKAAHLEMLRGQDDPSLMALMRFCETWSPKCFADFPDAASLLDHNVVFRLADGPFLHDLPAAHALLEGTAASSAMCLVSGSTGSIARLHPTIKGVRGAQSSGASLVSFNNDAETSHGKKQGANAPVSDAVTFAYGTALNALLAKGSDNAIRIGGDTLVFWAEQPEAENWINVLLSGGDDAASERELGARLRAVAGGRQPSEGDLDPGARLFILGLAPNAARLSVRYWYPSTLGDFAKALTRFWDDMAIEPSPFLRGEVELMPKPWALLYDVAPQRDADNIPANLGGNLMRSVLTGGRYPVTWLTALIGRLRVEGEPDRVRHGNVDGRRAAAIAAILRRNHRQEVPMALDQETGDTAYLLGRLFGAYVYAEKSNQARGRTLRQSYMGRAAAMPALIFPVLMRGYKHNLASLRKSGGLKPDAGIRADRAVVAIIDRLGGDMPATLTLEAQGRFFIGFYHQISALYTKAEDAAGALIDNIEDEGEHA